MNDCNYCGTKNINRFSIYNNMKNLIDYRTDHNIVYDCICQVDILMYVDPRLGIHTAIKNIKGISPRT